VTDPPICASLVPPKNDGNGRVRRASRNGPATKNQTKLPKIDFRVGQHIMLRT